MYFPYKKFLKVSPAVYNEFNKSFKQVLARNLTSLYLLSGLLIIIGIRKTLHIPYDFIASKNLFLTLRYV